MHPKSIVWIATIIVMTPSATTAFFDESQLDRWDRAVCLQSPAQKGEGKGGIASGFIVSSGKRLVLVTAAHAAKETQQETRLFFKSINGTPEWVNLRALVPKGKNPWVQYKNSDIATAELQLDKSNPYLEQLNAIAIPLESIFVKPVRRTTRIEIAGFPFGLSIPKQVTPIVVVGHIASTEIMTENKWGSEPLVYSSPDAAQGTSGGPAFLAAKDPASVSVVGMYVAVIYDVSGGKLSKLVPSRIIHAAIVAQNNED